MKIKTSAIVYGIRYIRRFGLRTLIIRIIEKKREKDSEYQSFYLETKASLEQLEKQRMEVSHWNKKEKISIVTPLYHTPAIFLRELIESVLESSYENWQLCFADATQDGEENQIENIVKEYQKMDEKLTGKKSRICYKKLSQNYGIAENTNQALAMAEGDYIAFLDHDDIITPDALYEMALASKCAKKTGKEANMFYSDEDKVNENRTAFFEPHFKPDFNQDLLNSNNYITHFLMVSRELLDQVGGINKEYDGAQDYDFILRCTELADNVIHIPKVLYHWRVHERSTAAGAGSKDYAIDAGKRAIESHLQRMGENGKVVVTPYFGFYRIEYGINTENKTEDYVLFADQSLKPLNADWKQILYADCSRKKIGVVGGKIYDRHHRIYEAAFFEKGDWTGTACGENVFSGLREGYGGYMHRANIQMDCDRVSEKCMLVKKEVLEQIEDYEQQIRTPEFSYIVCQKAKEMGYRIMYEPEVKMIFKS